MVPLYIDKFFGQTTEPQFVSYYLLERQPRCQYITILTHTDISRAWRILAIWRACTCMLDLLFFKEEHYFNPQTGRDHLEFLCLYPFKIWWHDLSTTAEDIQLPLKQGDTPSCITQRKGAIFECTHRFSPLQCISLGCTSCHLLQVP